MADSDRSPDNIFQFAVLRDPERFPSEARERRFIAFDWTLARGAPRAGDEVEVLLGLAAVQKSAEALQLINRILTTFSGGTNYIGSTQKLYSLYPDFKKVYEWLYTQDRNATIADLKGQLETAAGVTLATYCQAPNFNSKTLLLWENFVVQMILGQDTDLLQELTNLIRIHWIARRLQENDSQLQTGQDIYEAARATILLPSEIFPLPKPTDPTTPQTSPLYRLVKDTHFYTTSPAERDSAIGNGYRSEGIACYVFTEAIPGTTPLYRLVQNDHFYTTSTAERDNAIARLGYKSEGIACYVLSQQVQGTTAFYRLSKGDHFYTTSVEEVQSAIANFGYTGEGVACYVFPSPLTPARTPGQKDLVRVGGVVLELNRLCVPSVPPDPCTPYQYAQWPRTWGKVKPAGIADFKAVQTQLLLYGKGEIAQIENLMKGEKNTHVVRNFDRKEQVAVSETEATTQTQTETQTHDTSELSNETSQILKEDLKLDVGVNISANYGPVAIQANTGFSYQNSKETSNKIATKLAKDVMNRALTNITQRVRQQTTVTIIHETEDTVTHSMDNSAGGPSTSAIYRWVNKYYLARLINYGPHLMFDFVIPEPAAFYIFSVANHKTEGVTVAKPIPPWESPNDGTLLPQTGLKSFQDIQVPAAPVPTMGLQVPPNTEPAPLPEMPLSSNWERWAAVYGVQNLAPAPPEFITTSISIAHLNNDDGRNAETSDKLDVLDGYVARDVTITFSMTNSGVGRDADNLHHTDSFLQGQVGNVIFDFQLTPPPSNILKRWMNRETGVIPVSYRADSKNYAINIEVRCQRTQAKLDEWRIATFNAIMAGYQAQQQAYDDWLKSQETSPGVVIPGHNPDMNREVEREELKKSCIELLTAQRFESFDAMRTNASNLSGNQNPSFAFPEFDFDQALDEGKYIRFFEDAFEWPLMSYMFYPYFWGRKPNWVTIKQLDDPDPLFTKFLQAGAARVLVPVREKFNDAITHYLANGQVWNGGDVPTVDDPLYVSIADEMKEAAGHFEGAKVVDQWVVKMPTSFVIIDDPGNPATLPDNRAALNYTGNLDDL